ncbi:hypothetical protein LJC10_02445 [Selenomonadales bacterium OttesenSCG-928-I06]|nr:hypothetical protein [Selenomonadales bacterium OttesenSCG-928-I06]
MTERLKQVLMCILIIFLVILSCSEISKFEIFQAEDKNISWQGNNDIYNAESLFNKVIKQEVKSGDEINIGGKIIAVVSTSGGNGISLRAVIYTAEKDNTGFVAIDFPFNQKGKFAKLNIGDLIQVKGRLNIDKTYWDIEKDDIVYVDIDEKVPNRKYNTRVIVSADKWR